MLSGGYLARSTNSLPGEIAGEAFFSSKENMNKKCHFKKKTISAETRRELAMRYGCNPGESIFVICKYCSSIGEISWIIQPTDRGKGWIAFSDLEMDHVIAEFLGGETVTENLVLACIRCNRSKSIKSVLDWENNRG